MYFLKTHENINVLELNINRLYSLVGLKLLPWNMRVLNLSSNYIGN